MGSPTFADKIFDVFAKYPNQELPISQVIQEAGARPDGNPYDVGQVQTAISNLKNRGGVPIVTVVAGRVYRYQPGAKIEKTEKKEKGIRLFEHVFTLKDGTLLVQDENGTLYRAAELKGA